MSFSEKCAIVAKMIAIVEGAVGGWARDAQDIIRKAKEAIEVHNDDGFATERKNWDRHLLQAPDYVYRSYVMGQ